MLPAQSGNNEEASGLGYSKQEGRLASKSAFLQHDLNTRSFLN